MSLWRIAMDLLFALEIIAPLVIFMALGYFFRVIKLVDQPFIDGLNTFSYKFTIPLVVFYNLYRADFSTFNMDLLWFILISVPIVLTLFILIIHFTFKDNGKKGAIIQGFVRMNQVLFAISLLENMYGSAASGVAAVLTAVLIPITNVITVLVLTFYQDKGTINLKKMGIGLITNPFIVTTFLGLIVSFAGIRFPELVDDTLSTIAKFATPLALIALGAGIRFSKDEFSGNVQGVIVSTLIRLIGVPVLVLGAAILFGFRGMDLGGILCVVCAPTAVSSYQMAIQLKSDFKMARLIVVSTSLLSVFTIFLFVSFFHFFNLI